MSTNVKPHLPGPHQCFISHSYDDRAGIDACIKRRLPGGLQPFVFPPLRVTPDQAISEFLIDALNACAGLVYLHTPASLASFWVGFERNIAARLGKPIHAFRPKRPFLAFTRDKSAPIDPMVSVLFNLCIQEDIDTIQRIRALVWDRYRFEIRGDQWRRLDNEARQMFDSIDGMRSKIAAGGVALVFLSNASVTSGYHDYVDPFTYRRAAKDMETPVGYTAEKFAQLNSRQTLIIWLEPPDPERIEAALGRFSLETWAPYIQLVRASLHDPNKLVVGRPDGRLDLNHLDTMLARCFWTALQVDARLASSFRKSLTAPERSKPA